MIGTLTALILVVIGFFIGRRKKLAAKAPEEADTSARSDNRANPSEEAPELSAREKEILDLLSKGYTTGQIAQALNLSQETIRWYRKKLLEKFDVSNSPELISRAKEAGLI